LLLLLLLCVLNLVDKRGTEILHIAHLFAGLSGTLHRCSSNTITRNQREQAFGSRCEQPGQSGRVPDAKVNAINGTALIDCKYERGRNAYF
jgi:hypothetical protein